MPENIKKMNITDRFIKYVGFETTSDENQSQTPSTHGQMIFSKYLAEELKNIGLQEVELDANGYLMATLPANTDKHLPVIGFIAHVDTSPDSSGKNIKPSLIKNYNGKDILLNKEKNIVLQTSLYPEILKYTGQDIIVTDGTTLLGADDKAGVAAIVQAMEFLLSNPDIKHGKVRIGFTPDEEIGRGADFFDVQKFNADWAYTIDGGEIGELEYENFNAAGAKVIFKGLNVHPGYAFGKMKNSMRIAAKFVKMLPENETPEQTEGYQGFYHLTNISGDVETTTLSYIIRDHDRNHFEQRKNQIQLLVNEINTEFGEGTAILEMRDQYYNMREKIEPVMHVVENVEKAMLELNIKPNVKPIRGGTDGARLSFMDLPCPNIFAGGINFHSRFEYLPVQSMEKAKDLIIRIIENIAK